MKKQLFTMIAAGTIGSAFAQLPVSTTPQNRVAVLEEFTGVYCGYCPDGHQIANSIKTSNPTQVVLMNVHAGGYANVAAGEPDLKTTIGTAIDGMSGMNIQGYPAGDVSRINVPSAAQNTVSPFGMAQSRGDWSSSVNTIISQSSYCNVAVEATIDASTRVLTYTAQVYYTANSPVTTNSLTVVLLEDKVLGPQHNYGNPLYNAANYNADGSYNHNHVLRAGLTTGSFGITIPATTTGTTFTTTGSYTVPATYGAAGKTTPCLLGNLKVAAFVTETSITTITGADGPVNISNVANTTDGGVSNLIADAETCAGNLQPSKFNFVNNGSATITTALINYSVTGGAVQTYTFNGSLAPFTQTVITLPAYSFAASASNTLNISISNINGSSDQNTANDVVIKSIPLTTKISNSTFMRMDFTQDQYGTESTWEIREEVSNTLVTSGGPYTNLAASGVALHTQTFTASPNLCYKVIVNDAYGDGFNAGTGAGNYKIYANTGTPVYTMNGVMTTQDIKLFKTSATANGIEELGSSISNVSLFPNPAKNNTAVIIDLVQTENVTVNVLDALGQIVSTQTLSNLSAGNHEVKLNTEALTAGIYHVSVIVGNGNVSKKLVITK